MIDSVRRLVNSEDYSTLVCGGLVSPLAMRNLQMIEYYQALISSGVAPLRAARNTAKTFRVSVRQMYYVREQFGIS